MERRNCADKTSRNDEFERYKSPMSNVSVIETVAKNWCEDRRKNFNLCQESNPGSQSLWASTLATNTTLG